MASRSSDQDGDAVHRVAAVPLRVPVAGPMGWGLVGRVGRAGPHLVIAVAREAQRRRPAPPVVAVARRVEGGLLPGGAEVEREVDAPHVEVAGPGGPAQAHLARAGGETGAVG